MRRLLCLLCIIFVLMQGLVFLIFPVSIDRRGLPADGEHTDIVGKVYRIEESEKGLLIYVRLLSDPVTKVICNVSYEDGGEDIRPGNTVEMSGKCRHFEKATNEGGFDGDIYYRIQGLAYRITGCRCEIRDENRDLYATVLFLIRRNMSRSISRYIPEKRAGVLKSVLLGQKRDMDSGIRNLYKRGGISHILAISGLHISLIGSGIYGFLKRRGLNKCLSGISALVFILSFGVMTGNGASTVRSIIMFSLFMLSEAIGRTYDMLTACGVSAVFLLLIEPLYLYHSGFLLSFGAVMGIALLSPVIDKCFMKDRDTDLVIIDRTRSEIIKDKIRKAVKGSLTVTFSVSLATFPIQLWFYYGFSTYSPILNLIVVPLAGILIFAGFFACVFSAVFPFAGKLFFIPCNIILLIYEKSCAFFAHLPFAYPVPGRPRAWQIMLYYLILATWAVYTEKKDEKKMRGKGGDIRNLIRMLPLTAAILILTVRIRLTTTCTMLDVGQGDCLIIEDKSGANIMIDGGSTSVSEVGRYRVVPYLLSRGISRLDLVFLSHGDEDHYSAIMEIMEGEEEYGIKTEKLVFTGFAAKDEDYALLLDAAEQNGIGTEFIRKGAEFKTEDERIECLYPDVTTVAEGNDQSMVLLMECEGNKMLFTGDLTEEKEEESLPEGFGGANVLKVAHHGSRYSSSETFLCRVCPDIALISAGKGNRYGHPSPETVSRLEEAGADHFCTMDKGQMRVYFKKGSISVRTYLDRSERRYYYGKLK